MEKWIDIINYEGLYQVSNTGNIKSLGNGNSTDTRTKQHRILKTVVKRNGYEQVKLCKDGSSRHFIVHRLVGIHFIDNPNNLREINHIDGNKLNNHISNLEWISSSDNQKHSFKIGLQIPLRGNECKQSKPVNQYDLIGNFIKKWESINQVYRELGFNTYGIIKCCKKEKRYKTAYGYKWEYSE
jgi:hypothetical protein